MWVPTSEPRLIRQRVARRFRCRRSCACILLRATLMLAARLHRSCHRYFSQGGKKIIWAAFLWVFSAKMQSKQCSACAARTRDDHPACDGRHAAPAPHAGPPPHDLTHTERPSRASPPRGLTPIYPALGALSLPCTLVYTSSTLYHLSPALLSTLSPSHASVTHSCQLPPASSRRPTLTLDVTLHDLTCTLTQPYFTFSRSHNA